MTNKSGPIVYTVIAVGLFFYFYSESLLRQVTVCNADSEKFQLGLEDLVNKLPPSVRDAVLHNIEIARLKDSVASALNDQERVVALSLLAKAQKSESEREKWYSKVIKQFPNFPESATAYSYFLLNPESKNPIDIDKYHQFVRQCPPIEQFQVWSVAWNRLNEREIPDEKQFEFLAPLLREKPKYRNYHTLYKHLISVALKVNQKQASSRARELEDSCYDLKSIEEILEPQNTKSKKKKSKPKNKSKSKVKK